MLFNNPLFFAFLAVSIMLLHFGNQRFKKYTLLVISYVFYGLWSWKFLSLIFISTVVDYIVGKKIDAANNKHTKKVLLLISIIVNLGILGFFKYYNFFIDNCITLFNAIGIEMSVYSLNVILPVGISFYTFQTMSYTIDVYRGTIKHTDDFLDFSNYVAFFPQLVAGPIERASHLLPQLEKFNGIAWKNFKPAFTLMLIGYVKKVIISDNIAPFVDSSFSNFTDLGSVGLIAGIIMFSCQIYFDFSGYSDIARGIARLFNVDIMINFNQPYFALNPSEFWRRWHISLSSWLKDYLYISLGGNRLGKLRTNINLMLTMLLGGLWHGASWNFVFWGFLHGIYLVGYRIVGSRHQAINDGFSNTRNIVKMLLFQSLILFTWLPFRTDSINDTFIYIKRICLWQGGIDFAAIIKVVLVITAVFIIDLPAYFTKDHLYLQKLPKWAYNFVSQLIIITLIISFIINFNAARPFIYFQF